MPMSPYLRALRAKLGHDLLLLPSVTGVILDDARRLLLLRHAESGHWVAPGGAIEPDESPADAVVREVFEETGLWVEPTRLLGVYGGPAFRVRYRNGDETAYVMSVFACATRGESSGGPRPDGIEASELRFVTREELSALPLAPWARVVLPPLLESAPAPAFAPARWAPPPRR